MNRTTLDAYVARVLADAPEVTEAKRENLTRLLRPGARHARTVAR